MLTTLLNHLLLSRIFFPVLLIVMMSGHSFAGQGSLSSPVFKDSIVITKTTYGRGRHAEIYAGAEQEKLMFTASGKHGRCYQLFVFNMNGELIKQSRIQDRQTAIVSEIKKGNYLFELFNDDLRIENGSIVIK